MLVFQRLQATTSKGPSNSSTVIDVQKGRYRACVFKVLCKYACKSFVTNYISFARPKHKVVFYLHVHWHRAWHSLESGKSWLLTFSASSFSTMICPVCNQWREKQWWKPSQWLASKAVTVWFNCCKKCSKDGVWPTTEKVESNENMHASSCSTMICPVCNQWRVKRDWKPSQWGSKKAVTDNFNCCKVCSKDGIWSTAEQVEFNHNMCVQAAVFVTSSKNDLRGIMATFIETWMEQLSKYARKELSYYGGIRRRTQADETILVCSSRAHADEDVFDPGNFTYDFAFQLLWPELKTQYGWNAETVGDIWESILGYSRLANRVVPLALWIDHYIYFVYSFLKLIKKPPNPTFKDCFQAVKELSDSHASW